ncbi:NADPH-dependent F420 reductase [Acidobacterium sp. S8]|uniref:NADPH-dependent F420 reductase n=1 Tax=Acidobacterium sp. S8 TaxID=1641854 RepID=UPI00131ACBB5|nr:NADPH-dependent F420 reductase [Acidobacterium sp. S8]
MRIGFIGAGGVAQTISKHVLPIGHRVLLSNTRGPESLAKVVKELGPGAEAATPQQAAEQDIVILAVMWPHVKAALASVSDWRGRVLVDATNRIASMNPFSLGDISGPTSSEIVANHARGAKMVKAFNSVPMAWISDFTVSKPRTVLFMSGDDAGAKKPVSDLINQIGFEPLDLGSLEIGGRLQQLGGSLAGVRLIFNERLIL